MDLAELWSAGIFMAGDGSVRHEFDSRESGFIDVIVQAVCKGHQVYIEDLPPRKQDLQAKNVARLQGRILERCGQHEARIHWVQPGTWMNRMGYKGKKVHGSTAAWAKARSEELGYVPPQSARGTKLLQDYRDAFLICKYALETHG